MNGWTSLDRFLRTDPRDVGCAEAIAMLHVYVDLVAAGAPAQERYPGLGPLVVRDPFTDQDPGRPYPGVLQSVIHHMLNSHVHKIGDPVAHGTRSQITPSDWGCSVAGAQVSASFCTAAPTRG